MVKRKVLGRGLDALIPSGIGEEEQILQLSLQTIIPNPYQPREGFDEQGLIKLADSLAKQGLQQPLVVRKTGEGYQLVMGERRLRAARILGWKRIPAVVRDVDDKQVLQFALVENLQREDLNAIEEAKAFSQLVEKFDMTHEGIGKLVGKSRTAVTNTIRLLQLPQEVQDMVSHETLHPGAARALLSLPDVRLQMEVARQIVASGSTVREVEEMVREIVDEGVEPKERRKRGRRMKGRDVDPQIRAIEEDLQRRLQTRIRISYRGGKGRIAVEFYSDEELERLVEVLKGAPVQKKGEKRTKDGR